VKVYIPNDISLNIPDKELFILTRPFRYQGKWMNNQAVLEKWGIGLGEILFTDVIDEAGVILIPYSVNTYVSERKQFLLTKYNELAEKFGIFVYAFISGDWGYKYKEFERLIYFRMGGLRTQLSQRNQGFPVTITDRYQSPEGFEIREKQKLPLIGFCGHASLSTGKRLKEMLKFQIANTKRLLNNAKGTNLEPVFPSAYNRARLLKKLEESGKLRTNFIYREHYRAGAKTEIERDRTTQEYFDNIKNSDYVFCLRGGGNFSVRLYETLMMGRIPVFINTDSLLPFTDKIHWKKHVVWVEWKDRYDLVDRVIDFHNQLSNEQFKELQINNRELWRKTLSVKGILDTLASEIK
jgi:hypothetical protein